MTKRLDWSGAEPGGPEGPGVRAVLLCDDRTMAAEPARRIERLGKGVGAHRDEEIVTRIWTFADLGAGEVHAAVVSQAAEAGLLAIASGASHPLPVLVRGVLVEELLARLGYPTALWYFARREARVEEPKVSVEEHLRHLARSFGAAFFVTTYGLVAPESSPPPGGLAARLRNVPAFGIPHGGINE